MGKIKNLIFNLFIKIYNFISKKIQPFNMWDIFPFMHKILMMKFWENCNKHPTKTLNVNQIKKEIFEGLKLRLK